MVTVFVFSRMSVPRIEGAYLTLFNPDRLASRVLINTTATSVFCSGKELLSAKKKFVPKLSILVD